MHWRVRHQFRELIGAKRPLLNECCRAQYLKNTYQDVEFLLDIEGAAATSSAIVTTKSSVDQIRADRLQIRSAVLDIFEKT